MFKKVSEFEKSFPAVKNLPSEAKQKALDIFNAMMKDDPEMDEGMAIATAMSRAKKMMAEMDKEMKKDMEKEMKARKENMGEIFHHLDVLRFSEKKSIIEVLKAGKVHDRDLEITETMLEDFVKNFEAGVYGTEIQVNLGHNREGEAAGWITKLIKEGDRLLAEVEWTPLGIEKIKSKQFRFTSSELATTFPHFETGKKIKNVFIGVALTNVPAVKGMAPVSLSEQIQIYINNKENMDKLKKFYDSLMAKEIVTKAEFAKFQKLAEEVADEEVKSDVEEMEAAVEEKVEEVKEEEKEEVKMAEKKFVTLTEYQKLSVEHAALREKVEFKELKEQIEDEMALSESVPVGFLEEDIENVTKFMVGLSQEQRDAFKAIISKVRTVDLSVYGSTNVGKYSGTKDTEGQVADRAEILLNEGKAKDIREAQKMAQAELSRK